MSVTIHQFPCLEDNYGFLVRDDATGAVACIDTPDADAILRELARRDWTLRLILNTHWHADHAGGNAALKAATGADIVAPQEVVKAGPVDRVVGDGDEVVLGETRFRVLDTGGHTSGHISFSDPADAIVFVGDTLFPMGCGRLFEGTAEQMWTSLSRLAALPDETTVFSAHEYTQSNCRFALSVDLDPVVAARAAAVDAARARREPTVPTTICVEKATNPFLRAPRLRPDLPPAQAFGAIRKAKDEFKG